MSSGKRPSFSLALKSSLVYRKNDTLYYEHIQGITCKNIPLFIIQFKVAFWPEAPGSFSQKACPQVPLLYMYNIMV